MQHSLIHEIHNCPLHFSATFNSSNPFSSVILAVPLFTRVVSVGTSTFLHSLWRAGRMSTLKAANSNTLPLTHSCFQSHTLFHYSSSVLIFVIPSLAATGQPFIIVVLGMLRRLVASTFAKLSCVSRRILKLLPPTCITPHHTRAFQLHTLLQLHFYFSEYIISQRLDSSSFLL